MKSKLFSIFFTIYILHISLQCNAQIWTKIYWYTSGGKFDQGRGVVETTNGDLLVAGGALGNLVKVDRYGDIIWHKSYEQMDQAYDLVLTHDDGVCLVGKDSKTEQTWLIKTDIDGNKKWAKSLFDEVVGIPTMVSNAAGGFTILFDYGMESRLIITDQLGLVTHDIDLAIQSNRFAQLLNRQYVVVSNFGGQGIWMLDEEGNKIWERTLAGVRAVAATNDGGFVIMGYDVLNENFFLEKWNLDGNKLWRQDYPQLAARPFQYTWNKIVVNDKGEISFIGFVEGTSAFVAKTDAEGNLICARDQELENIPVTLLSMVATSDNGYAIAGVKTSGNTEDLFLMKTDSLCQTDDLEIIYNVDGMVDTVYARKFSFKYGPNPTANIVLFEIQPTGPLDGNLMLEFYDVLGQQVEKVKVESGIFPVSLGDMPSGVYIFKFREKTEKLGSGKIILHR